MTIVVKLSSAQQRWLDAEVAAGRYPSIEAAVQIAVENLLPDEIDDLDWTKPYLESARDAAAKGEVVTVDSVRERLARRIRDLGSA